MNVIMSTLWSAIVEEQSMNATDMNIIALHLHHTISFVFRNGNGVFDHSHVKSSAREPSCHMTWIVFGWFQKPSPEFQITFYSHNSEESNLTEHISGIIQRQSRSLISRTAAWRNNTIDLWSVYQERVGQHFSESWVIQGMLLYMCVCD